MLHVLTFEKSQAGLSGNIWAGEGRRRAGEVRGRLEKGGEKGKRGSAKVGS